MLHEDNLIWIDLEMTGLDPDHDSILEIATVVTDKDLNVLADGPEFAIRHPVERLEAMDDWNRNQHRKSGLWQRFRRAQIDRRVPRAVGAGREVADLRQFDLSGPAFPASADAAAGTLFPLSQSRRVDDQGARAAVVAGCESRVREGVDAYGAFRRA